MEGNTIPKHLDPRALEVAGRYWQTTSNEEGSLVIEELDKTLDLIKKEKETAKPIPNDLNPHLLDQAVVEPEVKPKTALQELREAFDKSRQSRAEVMEMVTDLLNDLHNRLDSGDTRCQ